MLLQVSAFKARRVEQVGTVCRISDIKTDGRQEVGKHGLNSKFSAAGRQEIFYRARNIADDLKI